jgi:hypothetical protein
MARREKAGGKGEQKSNGNGASDGFWVGYHVVCLIDLLGQKDKLANWDKIPAGRLPPKDFTRALSDTAGVVLKFKEKFLHYFSDPAWNRLPAMDFLPEAKKLDFADFCERCNEADVCVQQFSDTFVFYARMLTSHEDVTSGAFLKMTTACCSAMVESLAEGVPLRGALCIGPGVELAKHNFYGPALAEAHHLESKVAGVSAGVNMR